MESIVEFIKAALPWVLMGITIIIWAVNRGRKKEESLQEGGTTGKAEKKSNYETAGMCIGMSAGIIVGRFLYDNMTTGMCVGMCLGLIVGSSIDKKKRG